MTENSQGPGVGLLTMLLAEMQTTIMTAGLRTFDGNLDRFVIASVIAREVLYSRAEIVPISVLSVASSLDRPFETTRRHVNTLISQGYCKRYLGGVIPASDWRENPDIIALTRLAHDSFVRFAEDLKRHSLLPPMPQPSIRYDPAIGIRSAVDIMLAAADTNMEIHGNWLNLVIFSTIVFGNTQRFFSDPAHPESLDKHHAVRPMAVAGALNLTDATTRRRIAYLSRPGGPVLRTSKGLIASETWLRSPAARATSDSTGGHVRRILARAAASGFPFESPAAAYIEQRPPAIVIG